MVAWDDSTGSVDAAEKAGVPVADLSDVIWKQFAALVLSPGVPLTHPAPHWTVKRAKAAGIEIIGDIELFCRERDRHDPRAPFIAITGTNGKSTTTALIAHLLRSSGRDTQLGGNIGTAILSLEPPRTGRFHVIEVSSFQIDLAPSIDPSIGVLLNVTPDHLDRHGTLEHYASIKERLVAASDLAVVGVDDNPSRSIADRLAQSGKTVVRISSRNPVARGVYADGSNIYEADGADRVIASLAGIGSLRGVHNAQNAAAAIAVVRAVGLKDAEIAAALRTFPGLPHRMEEVGRRDNILFVNDFKATNADAAEKALASFSRIYWIAGGQPKEGGITSLDQYFGRIVKAYLIGEAAESFAETLEGKAPYVISSALAAALDAAAADAGRDRTGGEIVVLLSPACASYDQFRNFEERGDRFRALVRALDGIHAKGEAA